MEETDGSVPADSRIELQLIPANIGKRLVNYLIDSIVYSLLAYCFTSFFYPRLMDDIINQKDIALVTQITISFCYGLYMSLMEALFAGKTIGKFVTGTRVIYRTGKTINPQTAFTRGLCRIIPFEQFSAIGFPPNPWHDRWTGTIVIDEKKSDWGKIS